MREFQVNWSAWRQPGLSGTEQHCLVPATDAAVSVTTHKAVQTKLT